MSAFSAALRRAKRNGCTSAAATATISRKKTPCEEKPEPARSTSARRCRPGSAICRPERCMTAEEFLFHEARLLDTGRYEEWLALFTEDATYWLPLERNQKDPLETSSLVYDDR